MPKQQTLIDTNYSSIDPPIRAWAKKHSLFLQTTWPHRTVHVSSKAGECFQISIDPPENGQTCVYARCIEGRNDTDDPETWPTSTSDLDAALEKAFQRVIERMAPSQRYYPPPP